MASTGHTGLFERYHLIEEQYFNQAEVEIRLNKRELKFNAPNDFIIVPDKETRKNWPGEVIITK